MRRYRSKNVPEGARLVHNFYPGPLDDPGRDRLYGHNGFRYWITDEPGRDQRCYCGWLGAREHYGTLGVIASALGTATTEELEGLRT